MHFLIGMHYKLSASMSRLHQIQNEPHIYISVCVNTKNIHGISKHTCTFSPQFWHYIVVNICLDIYWLWKLPMHDAISIVLVFYVKYELSKMGWLL